MATVSARSVHQKYHCAAGILLPLIQILLGPLPVNSFIFQSEVSLARHVSYLPSTRPLGDSPAPPSSALPLSSRSSMLLVSLREHIVGTTVSNTLRISDKDEEEKRKIRLILASASPRRREILNMMGLQNRYDTIPSPLDESKLQSELLSQKLTDPIQYTRHLAEAKAQALAEQLEPAEPKQHLPTIVLGSDTIVELDGHILEKPTDAEDARRMLHMLSGRQHKVHTGVALVSLAPQQTLSLSSSFVDTAIVQFSALTTEDVKAYVATGEPLDKAGAYGIQGIGGQLVQSISGDFFTVMGLPMCRLSQELSVVIQNLLIP